MRESYSNKRRIIVMPKASSGGIRNIEELRNELVGAYQMVQADTTKVAQGKELGNIAGKIINTAKLQLGYSALRKEKPKIAFLEV